MCPVAFECPAWYCVRLRVVPWSTPSMAEKLPKVTASGVHQCRRSRPWWRVHPKRPWQSRYWLLRPWWWAHDKLVRLVPWLVVHLVPRRLLGRLEKRFDYGHVPPIAPDRLLAEPPRLSVWRSLQAPLLIFVLSLAGLALFSFELLIRAHSLAAFPLFFEINMIKLRLLFRAICFNGFSSCRYLFEM